MKDQQPVIQTVNLVKRFGRLVALDQVSFDIRPGEIHCLLGENGAGKTTLAECLFGFYRPNSGEICFKGHSVTISSPKDALRLGIGMVHQRFVLIRSFTVLENILLAVSTPGALLDVMKVEQDLKELCANYHLDLDLQAETWQLSVGEQQWIEILKTIYSRADLLILDEPTAVLTPLEVERLFEFLRKMKADGLSILLITHKLDEVMQLADRVTVLRKGRLVGTVWASEVTKEYLAELMVGRKVFFQTEKKGLPRGEPILEIDRLQVKNDRGQDALLDVSLTLHRNEILGIAGVSANGQRELFEVLIGVRKAQAGHVYLNSKEITRLSAGEIKRLGVGHVPNDRINEGLVMEFSVAENLILGRQRDRRYLKGFFLNNKWIRETAERLISKYEIAVPSPNHKTKFLSGGTMQRVILARELEQDPQCLVVNQPTCGLDVGVIEYVHQQLIRLREAGAGILLISEDLDEVFTLSDRIAVLFKGQMMGIFDIQEAQIERIGLLMAGIHDVETHEPV
jgi:simple sugar transport system ATP-binding protein